MPHLAISALGADRPGIVAAVTGVLVEQGCNLEDTSMSILRGHFAMMLVVAAPDHVGAATLEQALGAAAAQFDLVFAVRAIDDDVPTSPVGEPYALSVYGADRPGIVNRVAVALADLGVNVVDLATRMIGGIERPVYAMLLDVTLPAGVAADVVEARLDEVCGDLGVEWSLHPADADVLLDGLMAVRPVVRLPEAVLKRPAQRVGVIDEEARALATDLVDTMRASPACVGIAAPQIGVGRRAFVVDVSGHKKAAVSHGEVVLFDPEVLLAHGPVVGREGCMSVPDLTGDVARPSRLVVRGLGVDGAERVLQVEGFEARAFQHELDHLDGLLFLDRVASASAVFPRKVYR